MKGKSDAYVLWPLDKRVQNWIIALLLATLGYIVALTPRKSLIAPSRKMVGGGCLKRGSILLSPIFFRSNIQLGSHLYHNFSMSAIGKREVSKASIVVKIGLENSVNCSLKIFWKMNSFYSLIHLLIQTQLFGFLNSFLKDYLDGNLWWLFYFSHYSRITRYPSFISHDFFHFSSFIQSGPSMMSWVNPHPFNRVDPHP